MSDPSFRQNFLASIDPNAGFEALFNYIPEVLFFAKDLSGHYVAANPAYRKLYGCADETAFWGTTDFDYYPKSLAEKTQQSDRQVIEDQNPSLDSLEILLSPSGLPTWYILNKLAVLSKTHDVIGVMGILREYEHLQILNPIDQVLAKALAHIQSNFYREVGIPNLADLCELSVRQFERRFKEQMATTPQDYIVRLRVHNSCEALRQSEQPLSDIARDCGFYDQAAFSKFFKRVIGLNPIKYRQTYSSPSDR